MSDTILPSISRKQDDVWRSPEYRQEFWEDIATAILDAPDYMVHFLKAVEGAMISFRNGQFKTLADAAEKE